MDHFQSIMLLLAAAGATLWLHGVLDARSLRRRIDDMVRAGPVDAETGLLRSQALEQRLDQEMRRVRRHGGSIVALHLSVRGNVAQFGRRLEEVLEFPVTAYRVDRQKFALVTVVHADPVAARAGLVALATRLAGESRCELLVADAPGGAMAGVA